MKIHQKTISPPGVSGVFGSIEKGLPHKGEPLQTPSFNDID